MTKYKGFTILAILLVAGFIFLANDKVALSQPSQITGGLNYLKSRQSGDGSWGGSVTSLNGVFPTTAAALEALRALETNTSTNQTNAIQFLTSQTVEEN